FLRRAWASIVVVVKSGLSDRDHLGMARARDQLVDGDVELLVRVMRMGADRAVVIGKALGDGEHLGVAFDLGRDGDDARNAGRPRARNDGIELTGEIGKIEMAMAVDQCQRRRETLVFCNVLRHVGGRSASRYSTGTYGASFRRGRGGHPTLSRCF